ncbi:hypothetical protein Aeh1ORF108c [Aeromonas phage Aeh1]|uniref:HNH endonuclease n=1 Tax=Aeromonas phage Aeh1 TaxID=2880362 RepID=Q76YX7_9CAUD|nr:hypothetical protein Aeh1p114 [Aeromonas phage Aeh1]AAQ17769.1 hypothetical protein Aeh1ORF108c [Aeromonas phage Aeh1]
MRKVLAMTNVNLIVDAIKSVGNGSTGLEIANYAIESNQESFDATVKKQGSEEKARNFVYYVYDRLHNYPSSKNHVDLEVGEDGIRRFYLKDQSDLEDEVEVEEDQALDVEQETPDDYSGLSKQTISRKMAEKEYVGKLCKRDQIRYYDFWAISKRINSLCGGTYFDVDHATSVYDNQQVAFTPNNLQLLNTTRNKIKNSKSEARFTWEEQVTHIKSTVICATDGEHDTDELDLYIEQLKVIF